MPTPQEELQKLFDEAEKFLKEKVWLRDYGEHLEPRPKDEKPRESSDHFKQMVQPGLENGMKDFSKKIDKAIERLPQDERKKAYHQLEGLMNAAGMSMDNPKEPVSQQPVPAVATGTMPEDRKQMASRLFPVEDYLGLAQQLGVAHFLKLLEYCFCKISRTYCL